MESNEVIVKVRDFEQALDELNFALASLQSFLKEFEEKKEILSKIDNINNIKIEIDKFNKVYEELKKENEEFEFRILALDAKITQLINKINEEVNDVIVKLQKYAKIYETLNETIQKEAKNAEKMITAAYKKTLKNIKDTLEKDTKQLLILIKTIADELQYIYEKDYMLDNKKLLTWQKITAFLLITLIAFVTAGFYKINKQLQDIKSITYYNYKTLQNFQ